MSASETGSPSGTNIVSSSPMASFGGSKLAYSRSTVPGRTSRSDRRDDRYHGSKTAKSGTDPDTSELCDVSSVSARTWANVPTKAATLDVVDDSTVGADEQLLLELLEKDRVFEYRYSPSQTDAGLGLHIGDQIVTAHGWEIDGTESEEGSARFEILTRFSERETDLRRVIRDD